MPDTPEICGDLLGRVHRTLAGLSNVEAAGRLLDFYAADADRVGGRRGAAFADAVAAVREFGRRVGLTFGVLYGDPSPEVLRDEHSGALALIDWGAPSWGPLRYDLLSWQLFAADQQPNDPDIVERLSASYRAQMPLDGGHPVEAPVDGEAAEGMAHREGRRGQGHPASRPSPWPVSGQS